LEGFKPYKLILEKTSLQKLRKKFNFNY